jgi:hypothetical protein
MDDNPGVLFFYLQWADEMSEFSCGDRARVIRAMREDLEARSPRDE